MSAFIAEHNVPGAALAIGRNGKLIYEKGYGLADVAAQQAVTPQSRCRIASVSKPLTAVAVLKLVEDGKLTLEDSIGDIFHENKFRPWFHPSVAGISVRQLLNHTGGWDRHLDPTNEFDPMFQLGLIGKTLDLNRIATRDEMMLYMFSRPTDFEPGTRFAYSNFGYCVLGRIIELKSGKSYGGYVEKTIARPLGMKSLVLGRSAFQSRQANEVTYYVFPYQFVGGIALGTEGKQVPVQYGGWVHENLDSHGGWICTAGDLIRFATAFDDPANCAVLSPKSIVEMFARPAGNKEDSFYGLGWLVRPLDKDGSKFNSWHSGSLDGTSAMLVRRSDGLSWAVLFNKHNTIDDKPLVSKIDRLLHQAADQVKSWPEFEPGQKAGKQTRDKKR